MLNSTKISFTYIYSLHAKKKARKIKALFCNHLWLSSTCNKTYIYSNLMMLYFQAECVAATGWIKRILIGKTNKSRIRKFKLNVA